MRIIKNILLIAAAAIYFASCTNDECVLDTETYLNLEINIIDPNLIDAGFLDNLSVYSPVWTDSIHSTNTGASGNILFSLSPEDDSTSIIITSGHELGNDTLVICHQKELVFLSPECGFIYTFNIDTVIFTDHLIDSVILVNNELTIDEEGNIQIYF